MFVLEDGLGFAAVSASGDLFGVARHPSSTQDMSELLTELESVSRRFMKITALVSDLVEFDGGDEDSGPSELVGGFEVFD